MEQHNVKRCTRILHSLAVVLGTQTSDPGYWNEDIKRKERGIWGAFAFL